MIFVTVGTPSYGFTRLVKAVDDLVAGKKIREKVVIQLGYTKYVPKNCEWFRFARPEKIEELCKKCRIYVCHGGIGSLMMPLEYGKRVVAVPRLKEFGEHVDDHQLQIVKELERQGRIKAVYDISKLNDAITKADAVKIKHGKKKSKIIGIIEKFLEDMEK